MGFQDRDYSRQGPRGIGLRSAVGMLLIANLAIWLVQVATIRSPLREYFQEYIFCSPDAVFGRGFLWQIFTANFVHSEAIGHILGNMLFLFFFGRELEDLYGRRKFLAFYIFAGCTAILAEAAISRFIYHQSPYILGASGAVMGVVVLFTLHFPKREIYLGLLIPIQTWLLCIIYVLLDLSGALSRERGVAHWAHLAGAAVGLLYRYADWGSLAGLLRRLRWRLGLARGPRLVREPRRREPPQEPEHGRGPSWRTGDGPPEGSPGPRRDPVSERIDDILEKIHRSGRESLTPEELEFLLKNSGKYRSDR